ncbi:MAG: class I SAM-dependent methyltransferase [Rhodothermales bacterium]|nr:class I SAM-dependent methyltransferase [Rhodothermales bacterium]MBO6779269.1 class I SAM-dependent methyltransferase [Rhodothermales bacterium]
MSGHDGEAIQRFFDGWDLYKRVIEHDYMFHGAIHQALGVALRESRAKRILDVGCGDASVMAGTLRGLPLVGYTGVDLSPVALDAAADNLIAVGVKARLIEADYLAFLRESRAAEFDAIVAGYSLHHLIGEDITHFFRACRLRLTSGGLLLIYDVFRGEDESPETNVERNHRWRQETWTELTPRDLEMIWSHVSSADHPKSRAEMTYHAVEAGFHQPPELLYEAPTEIHRLYAFSV